MTKTMKILVAALAALALGAPAATAASLSPGDGVTLTFDDDGSTVSTFNGTIGAGADIVPYGALDIDLNAGVAGDGFTITSNGFYCGLVCDGSTVSMIFTGLDFGNNFTVDNFVDTTGLNAFATVLSDTSFSIKWTAAGGTHFFENTIAFSGTFADALVVPLPASSWLMLLGLGGLALTRKRA